MGESGQLRRARRQGVGHQRRHPQPRLPRRHRQVPGPEAGGPAERQLGSARGVPEDGDADPGQSQPQGRDCRQRHDGARRDGGAEGGRPRQGHRRRLRRQPGRHRVDQGGRDQGHRAAAGGADRPAGGRSGAPAHHAPARPASPRSSRSTASWSRPPTPTSSASSRGSRRRHAHGPRHAGVIIGNRDFFPDQLVTEARRDLARAVRSRSTSSRACSASRTPSSAPWRPGSTRKACADLFRRHRDRIDGVLVVPAELRRREGRGRHAEARRRSTCRCWCRPIRTISISSHVAAAARRVLRQDLRLQQPAPVRHSVQPDRAAHGRPSPPTSSARELAEVPRRLPRRPRAARARASAPSARARTRSTPRATARSCSRRPASASARSICRRCSTARAGSTTTTRA